jgi:hypothetical protein
MKLCPCCTPFLQGNKNLSAFKEGKDIDVSDHLFPFPRVAHFLCISIAPFLFDTCIRACSPSAFSCLSLSLPQHPTPLPVPAMDAMPLLCSLLLMLGYSLDKLALPSLVFGLTVGSLFMDTCRRRNKSWMAQFSNRYFAPSVQQKLGLAQHFQPSPAVPDGSLSIDQSSSKNGSSSPLAETSPVLMSDE